MSTFRWRCRFGAAVLALLLDFDAGPSHAQSRGAVDFNPNRNNVVGEETYGAPEEDKSEKKKVAKAPSFSKYSKSFANWCRLLEKDGRRDAMYLTLDFLSDTSTECPGCRAFFRAFAVPCKPRPTVVRRKPTPVPTEAPSAEAADAESPQPTITPTPPQPPVKRREPSTELLDAISRGLIEMREDKKRSLDVAAAVERLAKELQNPEGRSVGERDYFEILAAYLYAPVIELLEKPQAGGEDSHGPKATPTPPQVDDLFNS